MNHKQQVYSDARLLGLLEGRHNQTAESITEAILSDVDEFVNGAEQSDDITILVLHRKS